MKIFRNCPNEACNDCRQCYNYRHCQERLAARKRRKAAQAVKVTYCQPVRRPKNAYAYAVINSLVEQIFTKRFVTVVALILALILLAKPACELINLFVIDLEYSLGMRTMETTFQLDVPEIDDQFENVTSEQMEMPAEGTMEVTPVYPDAAPDEVYTATYLGARPYYVYFFTPEEKLMMAKVVYKEARGECERGCVAVAAVIINRYLNGDFGNSIKSVVEQENAFANISNVTNEMLEANPQCMEAVELACQGWDPTREWFEDGALFFYNPKGDLSEEARAAREGVEQYEIGNHNFHIELNET